MSEQPTKLHDELATLLDEWDAAASGRVVEDGFPPNTRMVYVYDVGRAEEALGRFMAKHGREILEALRP